MADEKKFLDEAGLSEYDAFVKKALSNIKDTAKTNLDTHINDKSNPHSVTKDQVGLGNVDNTSDAAKPISTATQKALDDKSDKDHVHDNYAKTSELPKDISVNEVKQLFSTGNGADGLSINYDFEKITSPFTLRERATTYGNGYFVIAGTSGEIGYSTDNGSTWTETTAFTTNVITGIAYGNGYFVAVDSGGKIWRTDIPTNEWVNAYSFDSSIIIESVRYINNEFVAVGHYGYVVKSNDGINWKVVHQFEDTTTDTYFIDIGYGNGKYVAVGNAGLVMTSTNGTTWYDNSITDYTTDIRCIAYANGSFVIGTSGGRIDYSTDAINWIQSNNPSSLTIAWIRNFAYGDNRLYVCMYASNGKGEIWLSEDKGTTWSVAYTTAGRLWCIAYGNDTFITSGDSGAIYRLNLNISWTETRPSDDIVYYKLVVIQNDGSSTVSDIYVDDISSALNNKMNYLSFSVNRPDEHTIKDIYDMIVEKFGSSVTCIIQTTGYLSSTGIISIQYMGQYRVQYINLANLKQYDYIVPGTEYFDNIVQDYAPNGTTYLPLTGGEISGELWIKNDVKSTYINPEGISTSEICIGENDEVSMTSEYITISNLEQGTSTYIQSNYIATPEINVGSGDEVNINKNGITINNTNSGYQATIITEEYESKIRLNSSDNELWTELTDYGLSINAGGKLFDVFPEDGYILFGNPNNKIDQVQMLTSGDIYGINQLVGKEYNDKIPPKIMFDQVNNELALFTDENFIGLTNTYFMDRDSMHQLHFPNGNEVYQWHLPNVNGTIAIDGQDNLEIQNSICLYSDDSPLPNNTFTYDVDTLYYAQGVELQNCDTGIHYQIEFPKNISGEFVVKDVSGNITLGPNDDLIIGSNRIKTPDCFGMYNNADYNAFGFTDAGDPCILRADGERRLTIATDSFDNTYYYYDFPEHSGNVLVENYDGYTDVNYLQVANAIYVGPEDNVTINEAGITVNGKSVPTISDIPTKTSQLTNDSNYATQDDVTNACSDAADEIYNALPEYISDNLPTFKTINGQSIIGSGDITIPSGSGSVPDNVVTYNEVYCIETNYGGGLVCGPDFVAGSYTPGFGFTEEGTPCIVTSNRTICVSTDVFDGDYHFYTFPEGGGTVALTSDIPRYQHTISIDNTSGTAYHLAFTVMSTSATAFTVASLYSKYGNKAFACCGYYGSNIIFKIAFTSSTQARLVYGSGASTTVQTISSLTDTVITIQ